MTNVNLALSPQSQATPTMTAAMKFKDAFSLEEKLTNLDSILKSRDITLLTKVYIARAMFFSIVMYRCEN